MLILLVIILVTANKVLACLPNVRSYDGTCNNLKYPRRGASMTPMIRTSSFEKRISMPNERNVSNTLLATGPIYDSNGNVVQEGDLNYDQRKSGPHPENRGLNAFSIAFGQFLSHDLAFQQLTGFREPGAFSIDLPGCTGVGIPDELCSTFGAPPGWRTLLVSRSSMVNGSLIDSTTGSVTGKNFVSSYLDLGTVYGPNDRVNLALRQRVKGLLKVDPVSNSVPKRSMDSNLTFIPNDCDVAGPPSGNLHAAGDLRVDENGQITLLHILFLREHNRLASDIYNLNPTLTDEEIFQMARNYNIARYQKIVYDEYLPTLFGTKAVDKWLGKYWNNDDDHRDDHHGNGDHDDTDNNHNLLQKNLRQNDHRDSNVPVVDGADTLGVADKGGKGKRNNGGYHQEVDASVSEEFDIAAYRIHTMLNLPLLIVSGNGSLITFGKPVEFGVVPSGGILDLPYKKQERGTCEPVTFDKIGADNMLRGSLIQNAQQFDLKVTNGIRNLRIGSPRTTPGNVDVESVNIFRGREHGIANFDAIRSSTAGLQSYYAMKGTTCINADNVDDPVSCFQQLGVSQEEAIKMKALYGKLRRVDAFVGLMAERHAFTNSKETEHGIRNTMSISSIGETSTKIILDQFKRVRSGDRFFYLNSQSNGGILTTQEIQTIQAEINIMGNLISTHFPDVTRVSSSKNLFVV